MRQDQAFAAALLDRDGTLVEDVPYNGDPAAVRPMPGARAALDRMRAAGMRLGVVSNQSGIARGLLGRDQVDRVNARVEQLLGPFDTWQVCPHRRQDRCGCRKPRPGMVLAAAAALGVAPEDTVVIGDIGTDVRAGLAAGAGAVLVPTPVTLPGEIAEAGVVVRDLAAAADWVLTPRPDRRRYGPRVLAVRSDSAGDVLLTGPALRAVAGHASHLTVLCGPRGRDAARLLPGIDEIIEWSVPWIDAQPSAVLCADVEALVKQVDAGRFEEAVIFTSFHQSPLPMALLLRMAGIGRISAISVDYPGSLLDVRHRVDEEPAGEPPPEPERALSLAVAAGFAPQPWDDGRLRLRPELDGAGEVRAELVAGLGPDGVREGFVTVHPGASVPARACPPRRCREIVAALVAAGHRVVVTGSPRERDLTGYVADVGAPPSTVVDLGGRTSLGQLAAVLSQSSAVVVANTGPAHLAAAVGAAVVSLFAPTVPYRQWGPYRVPAVRLGDPAAACRGTRATVCPVPGHPCLSEVDVEHVVRAVRELVRVVTPPRGPSWTGRDDGLRAGAACAS